MGGSDIPTEPSAVAGVWTYHLPGGWTVLAGKTDTDNDRLSLKTARPDDWWFHVNGMPGSHVILRARKKTLPNNQVLKAAAAIAAYHSKARHGGKTAVACTRARYVKKAKGEKPGTVHIRKQTIMMVRPELPGQTDHDRIGN